METGIFGNYTARLASKIVSKIVKKKLGYDAEIDIKSLGSNEDGEDVYFYIDGSVRIKKTELESIIKKALG